MARSHHSVQKRQRELAKQKRKKEKEERRRSRTDEETNDDALINEYLGLTSGDEQQPSDSSDDGESEEGSDPQ